MSTKLQTHRNLRVWQESLVLAEMVYRASAGFPKEERSAMMLQVRRSAISVVSNIAEGAARGSSREFLQFLRIARGSLAELDTQLLLAQRLGLARTDVSLWTQLELTGRLLTGLHNAIRIKLRPA